MLLFVLLCLRHKSGVDQTIVLFCAVARLSKTHGLCEVLAESPASLSVWCGDVEPPLLCSSWGNVGLISSMAFGMSNAGRSRCHYKLKPSWCLEFCSALLWLCVCLPCEYFMCCSHPLVAFHCWGETVFCLRSFRIGEGAFVSVPRTCQGLGDAVTPGYQSI